MIEEHQRADDDDQSTEERDGLTVHELTLRTVVLFEGLATALGESVGDCVSRYQSVARGGRTNRESTARRKTCRRTISASVKRVDACL